jgi:hypothetical protein
VKPFGRRGDMFGISLIHSEPSSGAMHHESVMETFYRLRLTRSIQSPHLCSQSLYHRAARNENADHVLEAQGNH